MFSRIKAEPILAAKGLQRSQLFCLFQYWLLLMDDLIKVLHDKGNFKHCTYLRWILCHVDKQALRSTLENNEDGLGNKVYI